MQTRKRAKSVSFGKKEKIHKEEPAKEVVEEKVVAAQPEETKAPEKVESKEAVSTVDTTSHDELSATLPKTEEPTELKAPEAATATPVNEFVTDNPLSASPDAPQILAPELPTASDNESKEPASQPEVTTPQPTETVQPTISPVQPESAQTVVSPELSATPPQSAFTIQENGAPSTPSTGMNVEKKRFGLYFFIIAFLSFALGLGAIAAANYFHLITLSMPKLSSTVTIPGIKSAPTATPIPTVAPTEQPVDLSSYTISVLNGSTTAGKAATVKTSLTAAGYKVTAVGNADKSDYTKTAISAKATVSNAYLTKLQSELGKTFAVDTTIGTLSSSSTTDVTVTLGSQTAQ